MWDKTKEENKHIIDPHSASMHSFASSNYSTSSVSSNSTMYDSFNSNSASFLESNSFRTPSSISGGHSEGNDSKFTVNGTFSTQNYSMDGGGNDPQQLNFHLDRHSNNNGVEMFCLDAERHTSVLLWPEMRLDEAQEQPPTSKVDRKIDTPSALPTSSTVQKKKFNLDILNDNNSPNSSPKSNNNHEVSFRNVNDEDIDSDQPDSKGIIPWRMRERMKTMNVALVLCLNIGTDPPDVVKSSPCARKECWIDPFSMPSQRAMETIGKTLQSQYKRWQPRAVYKQCLDPTVEELKKLCISLRRSANRDRVLFHYNGHGVPRPTPNGEVWVFNKSYTQYIPLSVYDLQSWLQNPAIYVLDCSGAGVLLPHFAATATSSSADISPTQSYSGMSFGTPPSNNNNNRDVIVLAACNANEVLPMNPELSADVFTSCLTTPITVALRWFISQNELSMSFIDVSFIERIPGKLTDRKTPLGELNWIFTAITDTIAWNILPRNLFQKLFRQDLLVASLFRNYLLAERIMVSTGCSPTSLPALPSTHHHSLWASWDLAVEVCLSQLHKILNPSPVIVNDQSQQLSFQHSRFFAEQLTAFEVWLQFGNEFKPPPEQLPMVLQVLLSQVHRLRALVLLKRFLDLGPWAVNLALSVGIFPYVLKLLQSPANEIRQVLVFIWAKILALDSSCQVDLVKDDGHVYFAMHLSSSKTSSSSAHQKNGNFHSSDSKSGNYLCAEQRVMSLFILSVICESYRIGQQACLNTTHLGRLCCNLIRTDPHPLVRQWAALCLAQLVQDFSTAKHHVCYNLNHDLLAPQVLIRALQDPVPEVRAASAFALGCLVGVTNTNNQQKQNHVHMHHVNQISQSDLPKDDAISIDLVIGQELCATISAECSPLVRQEAILSLARLVLHPNHQAAFQSISSDMKREKKTNNTVVPSTDDGCYRQIYHLLHQIQDRKEEDIKDKPKYMPKQEPVPRIAQLARLIIEKLEEISVSSLNLNSTVIKNFKSPKIVSKQEDVMMVSGDVKEGNTTIRRPIQSFGNLLSLQEQPPQHQLDSSSSSSGLFSAHPFSNNTFSKTASLPSGSSTSTATSSLGFRHPRDHFSTNTNNNDSSTEVDDSENLPVGLNSVFYEWSKEIFNQPMMQTIHETISTGQTIKEDPLSQKGQAQLTRQRRNMKIYLEAAELFKLWDMTDEEKKKNQSLHLSHRSSSSNVDASVESTKNKNRNLNLRQCAVLDTESQMTSMLVFHPYKSLLVVAEEKKNISLWNYEQSEKIGQFINQMPDSCRLTSLGWINETQESLLFVGSDDGNIKFYDGVSESDHPVRLRSGFQAFTTNNSSHVFEPNSGSGLVVKWEKTAGTLYAGGSSDSSQLVGWDLGVEQCRVAIPLTQNKKSSCITTITSNEQLLRGMVISGFSDGSLGFYDTRARRPDLAWTNELTEHQYWVVQTHLYPERYELLTGSVFGDVKYWDLRYLQKSVKTIEAHHSQMTMTSMVAHNYAPIFASGSHHQFIKLFNHSGDKLALIQHHEGFLGDRIGPVSCLGFHPHRLVLAAGAFNSLIAIYSNERL